MTTTTTTTTTLTITTDVELQSVPPTSGEYRSGSIGLVRKMKWYVWLGYRSVMEQSLTAVSSTIHGGGCQIGSPPIAR